MDRSPFDWAAEEPLGDRPPDMSSVAGIFDLTGRTAVITGAASGQGRSAAMVLSSAGARLFLGDVDVPGVEETAGLVAGAGGQAVAVRTDVSKRPDVQALIDRAVTESGKVDVMANVAGIPFEKLLLDTTEEELDRVLAINMKGVFYGCQAAMKVMMEQQSGSIINISSGIIDGNGSPYGAYGISKAGVAMMTRFVAKEAGAYGVRANCVAPGLIDTPFLDRMFQGADGSVDLDTRQAYTERIRSTSPLGMVGTPDHIAHAILWLASDASEFVTGQIIRPNGGNSTPW